MPVNLFGIIAISIALSGCFSSAKKEVIIVEKSFNQQNISETPWTEETTSYKKTKQKSGNKKKTRKSWSIPVNAKVIKTFSKSQSGLTFDTKTGQQVRAIREGKVVYSGDKMKSHGKMIIIKHPLGFYSSYTQNKTLKVADGDKVNKGQIIAITGKTPFYFEMKKFSEPINPLKYLK
ncbi:M23 family metallopeptidase [Candidatus Thioglobus sp.]|jgi:Membrane-bound metallopeptidase|uniref:murein hydrolase activator EnvC family protein n=1 Tax=Candidatus Thioglobus sp. TaxID=2026721 RepID=UPI0017734FBD|nr:M23 family metallopeptidase [Candidatus Thioglobus sp.]